MVSSPGADIEVLADPNFAVLSHSERTRFQRGFLRYELFARVFPPRPENGVLSLVFAPEQARRFLNRLPRHEIEEMACVHNFLALLAGEVVDDLEERFMRTVLRARGVTGLSHAQQYGGDVPWRYSYGIAKWGRGHNGFFNAVRRHRRLPPVHLFGAV